MKTVYCDVVFLQNFVCDCILLSICGKFLHIKQNIKRLVASSVIGGVFAVVCGIILDRGIYRVAFYGAFSYVLCRICFGKCKSLTLIKASFTYTAFSACLCGCVLIVANICDNKNYDGGVSVWIVFCAAALMWTIFGIFEKQVYKASAVKTVEARIQVSGKDKKYTLLCDSGNLLCDPYSSLPVIILKEGIFECSEAGESFIRNKMRYIPIQTAQGEGIIKAVRPEKIELVTNDGIRERAKIIDAIVGFAPYKNADYGGTDGIIPCCLVENL